MSLKTSYRIRLPHCNLLFMSRSDQMYFKMLGVSAQIWSMLTFCRNSSIWSDALKSEMEARVTSRLP